MATRRPKVPRAAAAAPASPAAGRGESDGGDVIRADFGGSRQSHATGAPAGRAAGATRPGSAQGRVPSAPAPGRKPSAPASSGTRPGTGEGTDRAATQGTAKTAPAGAAKTAAGPATPRPAETGSTDPVPAKAFSGRMLALALVMVAITILLAPTVKIFLEKRSEIAGLEADISAKQAQQTDLKRQISRWQDPNFVKQQARDRINMVMPGETGYWVFGSDMPATTPGTGAAAGTAGDPANLPWVDSLWESIRRSATD